MTAGRIIDVSADQHPGDAPINWHEVAGAGVTAAFVKATQGTDYINPFFQSDMIGAQQAGLVVCAYHFADMGNAVAEAKFFVQQASRFARMLDFETHTDVAWARTFLHTLGRPASELITYGSASTLKDFYAQLPSLAFPAAYSQFYPGWGACWQFTDAARIPGIVTECDEDQWHGSQADYDTLFSGPIIPPPEPTPAPTLKGATEMDSVVAPNGDIVGHYRTPDNHLLEVTRKAGTQGEPANPPGQPENLSVIDITAQYPTVLVVS
jgi:GH25 family lysozyme M1 (1,4-beta-N-acetylmuramidase)